MNERQVITISAVFLISFMIISGAIFRPDKIQKIVDRAEDYVAGIFFRESVDDKELVDRYEIATESSSIKKAQLRRQGINVDDIKVLIVPGHDDVHSGTVFKGIREVDLNRDLAKNLYDYLNKEDGFDVTLASDANGYNKDLEKYFEREKEDILNFRSEYKEIMDELVEDGKVDLVNGVFHNSAPSDVALKLYGINRWVNEEDFDIVLHIHFNDYPRKSWEWGKFNGFAIYVPEEQFSNARASKVFARHLLSHFNNFMPVSNHSQEKDGIVEDQELIAIGAYNTVDAISVLVEYGYIYESQFSTKELRDLMMKELAFQTFKGMKNFFNDDNEKKETTLVNKDILNSGLYEGQRNHPSVLGLQALLRLEGNYPPEGKTLNDCPITGNFGPCTKGAIKDFQDDNGLSITGYIEEKTKEILRNKI